MKILVTGGAGFIGSHVVEAYLDAGHEVVVVDDLSSGHAENVDDRATFHRLDVRSPEVARLIADVRPDVINHHAAQMNVRLSVENPSFDADINVMGLVNVFEAGRNAGTRRLVFASSGGTVYGEPDVLPTDEGQPLIPVCPYGITKLTGEHYLEYYARVHGMHTVALRYANIYGPRQDPHGEAGVVAIFSQLQLAGKTMKINGDGLQTRDYVFVGDVVRANVAALETSFRGAVNIGTGVETSVVDLAARLREIVGGDAGATHAPANDGEVRRSVLDASLAARALDWTPRTSLDEGLAATVDYFRARA